MAIIESGIPFPETKRNEKRKLSATAQELLDSLTACKIGDSFVVSGDLKSVATVAGRMATRIGAGARTASEFAGATRVWRVAAKPKKVKTG